MRRGFAVSVRSLRFIVSPSVGGLFEETTVA